MIHTKNRIWNKYKRNRQTSHLRQYRDYCISVKLVVSSEPAKYEKSKFNNRQYKPKEFQV